MKKILLGVLAAVLVLSTLCSCSLFNFGKPEEEDPEVEKIVAAVTGELDLDSLSLDELKELYKDYLKNENDALNDGADFDLLYKDVVFKAKDLSAEASFDYAKGATVAVYSDEEWVTGKDFEALDPTVDMTDAEKAEYDSMMKGADGFDAAALQKEITEMLAELGVEDVNSSEPAESEPETSEPESSVPVITDEWPDNAVTKGVPKPSFKDASVVATDDVVSVLASGVSVSEVKSYAAKLKSAGFTNDVSEDEQEYGGQVFYSFSAQNGKGLSASIAYAAGEVSVSIVKG